MPDTAVAAPPRPGGGQTGGQPQGAGAAGAIGHGLRDPENYEEISVIGNGKSRLTFSIICFMIIKESTHKR